MPLGPGESIDEAQLVARVADGDDDALAAVYDRYAPLIFGTVIRFSGDRERAAEVVQDTFLALWRRARWFDPATAPLAGWLVAIARHRAIDRFRADARRPALVPMPVPAGQASGPGSDPDVLAERRWTQSVVASFVSQLPAPEREVLVLAYAGGLSQAEVADRTGLPLGTVKSRTRRALARLRLLIADVPDLVPEETRRP
jgi:RNA polymerase sigma-70 factor, ECF subfamily